MPVRATSIAFTPRCIAQLWDPQPSHALQGVKSFKAGLHLNGREAVAGDITFQLQLAAAGKEYQTSVAEQRTRSQVETKSVFWTAALDDAIDRETVEIHRSQEMLKRKERTARTNPELSLVTEEKHRLKRHQDQLEAPSQAGIAGRRSVLPRQ